MVSVMWRPNMSFLLDIVVLSAMRFSKIGLLWNIIWQSFIGIINTFIVVICFLYFTDLFESLMVSLGGGKWQCVQCGHQSQKFNVKCHIEAKHMESFEYPCPQCHEILKNRWALKNHVTKFHR